MNNDFRDGLTMVRANVRQAPYASLGIALGLGMIIGGGMWRVLARTLVGTGARFAVAVVVPALLDRNQDEYQKQNKKQTHKEA